jgi:hypothetical protein
LHQCKPRCLHRCKRDQISQTPARRPLSDGYDDPEVVPLLIPEYRYEGAHVAHRYRLDFCIINPFTMQKIGYELSPWSTHGYLSKLKGLTQAKINEMAKDNFEKEMTKHRSFFKRHNIFVLIYTDKQLADIDEIFND